MEDIINAKDLRVAYNGTDIIGGLDFKVARGDVLAVLGPNGSGKTTLLKAILGMIPLRAGSLRIFGKERLGTEEAEKRIAYIPQRMQFDRTFPISLKEMLSLSRHGSIADKYIDILELRQLFEKKVGELSGGQMQRALLAYAIMKEPELLVMDEPTSWVDVKGVNCVLCIMEEFRKKGITMVVVSHDFSELREICTHVLGLGPGPAHAGTFFEPVDSPALDEKLKNLFGTPHEVHRGHCHTLSISMSKTESTSS